MEGAPASAECHFLSGDILITQSNRVFRRKDREFLHQVQEFVRKECKNQDFGLTRLAAALQISERQVQRKLVALVACTPSEYIRNHRLQMALTYLRQGYAIGEVATMVGFASQSYFASCFKTRYGLTPTEFQQKT